jgi:quercetin dioxygenase-like cupin family protein
MDINEIKDAIVKNVYHIDSGRKVALHKHDKNDELFYCIAGNGFGVLEGSEVELATGKVFTVPAGKMHALRTDSDLYVCSFLIPLVEVKS